MVAWLLAAAFGMAGGMKNNRQLNNWHKTDVVCCHYQTGTVRFHWYGGSAYCNRTNFTIGFTHITETYTAGCHRAFGGYVLSKVNISCHIANRLCQTIVLFALCVFCCVGWQIQTNSILPKT